VAAVGTAAVVAATAVAVAAAIERRCGPCIWGVLIFPFPDGYQKRARSGPFFLGLKFVSPSWKNPTVFEAGLTHNLMGRYLRPFAVAMKRPRLLFAGVARVFGM
jgi:hypothetical protein